MDADDRATAWQYLVERAHQAAIDGWRPLSAEPEPLTDGGGEWGVRGRVQRDGREAQSIYVYRSARGGGRLPRYLASSPLPVVTTPDCHIEDFARVAPWYAVDPSCSEMRHHAALRCRRHSPDDGGGGMWRCGRDIGAGGAGIGARAPHAGSLPATERNHAAA